MSKSRRSDVLVYGTTCGLLVLFKRIGSQEKQRRAGVHDSCAVEDLSVLAVGDGLQILSVSWYERITRHQTYLVYAPVFGGWLGGSYRHIFDIATILGVISASEGKLPIWKLLHRSGGNVGYTQGRRRDDLLGVKVVDNGGHGLRLVAQRTCA